MVRCLIAAFITLLSIAPSPAQEKRAFVLGINNYLNVDKLKNAVGDASAVAAALTKLGFKVVVERDLSRADFNSKWLEFVKTINPGDTVAFAFSGHGVQLTGINYLLPRDVPKIRPGREELLKRESWSLEEVFADLRDRRPELALVIIDACRDNPFVASKERGFMPIGLASVDPPAGVFVLYSAAAGQTALDRLSDDDRSTTSVYTRTLVPLLTQKGLSVLEMADTLAVKVRDLAATVGHPQVPAFYSNVAGAMRLCLAGCEGKAEGAARVTITRTDAAPLREVKRNIESLIRSPSRVLALDAEQYVLSPDGRFLVVSRGPTLLVYSLRTYQRVAMLNGHEFKIALLSFVDRPYSLVSADEAGHIRTWSMDGSFPDGEIAAKRRIVEPVTAVSQDGRFFASKGKELRTTIFTSAGEVLSTIPPKAGFFGPIGADHVRFSSGGSHLLLTHGSDGAVYTVQPSRKVIDFVLRNSLTRPALTKDMIVLPSQRGVQFTSLDGKSLHGFDAFKESVTYIAISPNTETYAMIGNDEPYYLRDEAYESGSSKTYNPTRNPNLRYVIKLFASDGKLLSSFGSRRDRYDFLGFSRDGAFVVAGGENGRVVIYNVDGKLLREIHYEEKPDHGLFAFNLKSQARFGEFAPDGDHVIVLKCPGIAIFGCGKYTVEAWAGSKR